MKLAGRLLLAVSLMTGPFLCGEEISDEWVGHWINGIEFSKDQNNYPKAIDTYNTAIQKLAPDHIGMQLNLAIERGYVYYQMLDYPNAIKDFSFVINHPKAGEEQKIEALWGRSKAYLASGKIDEFEKDSHELEGLQFFFHPIAETKEYAILKVNPSLMKDVKAEERFVKILLMRKEIKSEKDVTFTPSGLIIVKKTG